MGGKEITSTASTAPSGMSYMVFDWSLASYIHIVNRMQNAVKGLADANLF